MFLAFLAFAYVVVGVAGEISCAEESLAATSSIGANAGTEKSDKGSTKAPEEIRRPKKLLVITPLEEHVGSTFELVGL